MGNRFSAIAVSDVEEGAQVAEGLRQQANDLRSDLNAIDQMLADFGARRPDAYLKTLEMRAWAVAKLATYEADGL